MIESFIEICRTFPYALLCGCLLAVSCSAFGVFVLTKRLVFISIAMSECSACGIALASLFCLSPVLGASAMTLFAVCMLSCDWERWRIPRDAILGGVFVFASALSVLLVSRSGMGLLEVKVLLYGDLLLVSPEEFRQILCVHLPLLVLLLLCLKPLLYAFLDSDGAKVAGLPVRMIEIGFFIALGFLISSAAKTAGSLLVFCYLSVPPAIGLLMSRKMWVVIFTASICGIASTLFGLVASYHWDLAGNQCIIVANCLILAILPMTKAMLRHLFP